MFNYVNGNHKKKKIESAVSTGQGQQQKKQQQEDDDEKRYLEDDDQDEVTISQLPELSEDDVNYLVNEYKTKLKNEHEDNEKVLQKIDKFFGKFDVKRFMKQNPHMTASDFNMIMFNETSRFIN